MTVNGVHDMGGMQGYGPIIREENEPVFHHDWERKIRAMVVSLSKNRLINLDEVRYAIERVRPDYYVAFSYYERWLFGLLILLLEKGLLNERDIQNMKQTFSIAEHEDLLDALTQIKYAAPKEEAAENTAVEVLAKFKPGEWIQTKRVHSKGHIRLPGYAKGKRGTIKEIHGNYKLPESNVYTTQAVIEPVYLVEFEASELWGAHAARKDKVLIDLWESYLERRDTY